MFRASAAALALTTALIAAPSQGVQQPAPSGRTGQPGAAAPTALSLPNDKSSVKFAVIGDTGTGGREQYEIATGLAKMRAQFPYEFVLMLGDNMYGGESPADFVKKFEAPYKPILDAGVKFYAALGNHDEPSQRFYKPFNMEGKRYYTVRKEDVEFFVLDSTYMSPAQLDWLKTELSKSDAKWKIPYMHHPLYSSGEKHGSEVDLRSLVEPLFIQYGVDVVLAGHEHFYERIKPQQGIVYITEGGSAKLRAGNIASTSALTAKGFDRDMTFMVVEILKDQMFFETISRNGQRVDSGIVPRREVTPVIHAATN